jgi:hypothetical protein
VVVVLDENLNGIPESTEWINGVPVRMVLPDGTERTALTLNGKAVFDLSGLTTGAIVTFELPSLYRTSRLTVPMRGIAPVVFVFFPPPITPLPSELGTTP